MKTNAISKQKITVGLDIGTTKIVALVAAPDPVKKALKIYGFGIAESEGLNRGVVVNIEKTVKAIKNVVAQAELQSGLKIEEVTVGIAGDHIESFKTRCIVGISNPNQEITQDDVNRLLDDARKISISPERKIIHVLPQEYVIDGQDRIIDPIGMSGVRLEAEVNIITGLSTAIQNIYRCVERAGLKVKDLVLEPVASSHAVLTEEEKEVGVALIDIGGGTTDVAIFVDGVIRFSSVFGIAGKHVTDDIRQGLGVIAKQAEQIKREYGHCYRPGIMKDEIFMIPGIGGRKPMEATKSALCTVVQARMEELFEFALAELRRSGYGDQLGAGVVITGGTTLLRGTEDLAREVFGMPVKIGIPSGITYSGLAPEVESPVYATSVGLALYGIGGDINKVDFDAYQDLEELVSENQAANKNKNVEAKKAIELEEEDEEEEELDEEELIEELDEEEEEDEEEEKPKAKVKAKKEKKDKKDKPSLAQRMKKFIEEL